MTGRRPGLLSLALLATTLAAGCAPARAQSEDLARRLEAAAVRVEVASRTVAAQVAVGRIDLKTEGPALALAYARLGILTARLAALTPGDDAAASGDGGDPNVDALLRDLLAGELADGSTAAGSDAAGAVQGGAGGAAGPGPSTGSAAVSSSKKTSSSGATAARTSSDDSEATTADVEGVAETDKTGIPSIDAFLASSASLSAQLLDCQTKMESARAKLTSALALGKKFKADEAKMAMKNKLGTGWSVSMGPPVKVNPGSGGSNPDAANDIKAAITDLLSIKTAIPKIVATATQLVKEGADIPKKVKPELLALGPVKSAAATGKVAKQVKTLTKLPKDAKALGDEAAQWLDVFGG